MRMTDFGDANWAFKIGNHLRNAASLMTKGSSGLSSCGPDFNKQNCLLPLEQMCDITDGLKCKPVSCPVYPPECEDNASEGALLNERACNCPGETSADDRPSKPRKSLKDSFGKPSKVAEDGLLECIPPVKERTKACTPKKCKPKTPICQKGEDASEDKNSDIQPDCVCPDEEADGTADISLSSVDGPQRFSE